LGEEPSSQKVEGSLKEPFPQGEFGKDLLPNLGRGKLEKFLFTMGKRKLKNLSSSIFW
jgi:hypothetical protein